MKKHQQKKQKLNGYALYVVLMVAVLVALFSSAFILLTFYFKSVEDKIQLERKLMANANSGIQYLLSAESIKSDVGNSAEIIDLYENGEDSVALKTAAWGLYQYITAKAIHGNQNYTANHLVGAKIKDRSLALYLSNSNKELGVTGTSRLKGNVKLPEKGISRAYVEGKNFSGRVLVEGEQSISGSNLPEINAAQLLAVKSYLTGSFPFDAQLDYYDFVNPKRGGEVPTISSDTTVLLYSEDVIELNDEQASKITRKCIIQSNQAIYLTSSKLANNCILVAPYIEVAGAVKKGVQLFAADSLVVQDGAELLFPSVVAISSFSINETAAQLKIGKRVKLYGSIVALQDQFQLKNNSLVTINEGSLIKGQIYAQGYLQLKDCKIEGQVFANKLILKTSSSVYENLLMDVAINIEELDSLYSGLLFKDNIGKAIIE